MTRAADRLVVCGAVGERGKPPGCWYDLVHAALTPVAVEEPADDGDGTVWRLRSALPAEIEAANQNGVATASAAGATRPAWLDQEAPHDQVPERSLSPSLAEDEGIAIGPTAAGGAGRAGQGAGARHAGAPAAAGAARDCAGAARGGGASPSRPRRDAVLGAASATA